MTHSFWEKVDLTWDRWHKILTEPKILPPNLINTPLLVTGNTVHHVYHMAVFEKFAGFQIENANVIVEFGAGYGNTCRLIHQLGFTGRYYIYDLPQISRVQKRFLESCGINTDNICWLFDNPIHAVPNTDIFIAEWSLSEAPDEDRNKFLDIDSLYYLLAYSTTFFEIDSRSYFDNFKKRNQHISWKHEEIRHIPKSYYMLGKPK